MNASEVNEDSAQRITFVIIDYILFYAVLAINVLIGLYYGCYRQQNTVKAYVFGGKKMKILPVAISLIASNTNCITLLSVPADIYKFGANYIWLTIAILNSCLAAYFIFIPVFSKVQLANANEYLQIRFDKRTRFLGSSLFTLFAILNNPIFIYVPALAFSQASGLSIYVISPIVCMICIFYTTIGGLKAVVLTDTLQSGLLVISTATVTVMGIISVGGFSNIIDISKKGQRLDILNFDLDPTLRDGFWNIVIGGTIIWTEMICVNQTAIQRFMSVPSLDSTKKVIIIFCLGVIGMKTFSVFSGLLLYAKYWNCDPQQAHQIDKYDQLIPYYVMDVAKNIPGLSGFFIAGVFNAGLSHLATTLNTLSATIYDDFLKPFMPSDIKEKKINIIMKLTVVILGILSTLLVFVIQNFGGILPLAVKFKAITGGPMVGLFVLGILFPQANAKGAFYGGISSLLFGSVLVFGNQYYRNSGILKEIPKPISTDGCGLTVNMTTLIETTIKTSEQPFILFRISFWYFMSMGLIVTVVVGLLVSTFTKNKNDTTVHPDLMSPLVHRFLTEEQKKMKQCGSYATVEKAMELVKTVSDEK